MDCSSAIDNPGKIVESEAFSAINPSAPARKRMANLFLLRGSEPLGVSPARTADGEIALSFPFHSDTTCKCNRWYSDAT